MVNETTWTTNNLQQQTPKNLKDYGGRRGRKGRQTKFIFAVKGFVVPKMNYCTYSGCVSNKSSFSWPSIQRQVDSGDVLIINL